MTDSDLEKALSVLDRELDAVIGRKENLEKDFDALSSMDKKIENVLTKSEKVDREEHNDLKARDILLKYYSSECTIHGAYILTIAIGVFTFLQLTKPMNQFFIPISFGLSAFATIGIYLMARTIFWGTLVSAVTHIRELSVADAEKGITKDRDKINYLLRLHRACVNHFTDNNKKLNYFVGIHKPKTPLLYVILFVSLGSISWGILTILF
jgi:hypothetical protein